MSNGKNIVLTESIKQEIVDYFKSRPISLKDVAKKFNCCIPTISKILNQNNLKPYPKNQICNPNIKEDFFDIIDTEEKAYFIGLIIADGNVYVPNEHLNENKHGGQKWTSITLTEPDSYMLERFRNCLGLNTKVSADGRGSSYIAARSDKIANSLEKYGIIQRKSFSTKFPDNIPDDMIRHVIRGLIDGDGSIDAHFLYTQKDNRNRFKHKIALCGTHRLMQDVINILTSKLSFEIKPKVYDYKNKLLSEFRVSNIHDMNMFGDWLYKDSTIFLKRKYEKFMEFKQHYNLS